MPGLTVSLNGMHLATVSTDGWQVLTIHVHGDRVGPKFAEIHVNGGRYGQEKDNQHLIWVNEHEIHPGDEVEVSFVEKAETSHPGKTIEELYPREESATGPRPCLDEVFRDLAQMPKVRNKFAFHVTLPSGETIDSCTGVNDHDWALLVVWDWTRPAEARASLTSNSLENVQKRIGGVNHANVRLQVGQQVKLRIGA